MTIQRYMRGLRLSRSAGTEDDHLELERTTCVDQTDNDERGHGVVRGRVEMNLNLPQWIGNTFLDSFESISPAFLNPTGLM